MDDLLGNTGQTAANTGAAADALSTSTEELEYLRDIAERDAINRFTTAEVKIDMTGMQNRIEGGADLDGVISTLTDGFTEAMRRPCPMSETRSFFQWKKGGVTR